MESPTNSTSPQSDSPVNPTTPTEVDINASLAAVADAFMTPDLVKIEPVDPAKDAEPEVKAEVPLSPLPKEPVSAIDAQTDRESKVRALLKAGATDLGEIAEDILIDAVTEAGPLPQLLAVMARLRAPGGCPWDREQTRHTLKQQIIEEVYELVEAIEDHAEETIKEELGDILLHVVFHSHIGKEEKKFNFADVVKVVVDKLVRRHPHVFADVKAEDSATVLSNWNAIKAAEKPERTSALDGVPRSLPALMRAHAVQKKAAKVGFDWPDADGPKAKVREELEEFERELPALKAVIAAPAGSPEALAARDRAEDELGDLLFAVVNWSRHLNLDPEEALNRATKKFSTRFRDVETELGKLDKTAAACSIDELEALWSAVKARAVAANAKSPAEVVT